MEYESVGAPTLAGISCGRSIDEKSYLYGSGRSLYAYDVGANESKVLTSISTHDSITSVASSASLRAGASAGGRVVVSNAFGERSEQRLSGSALTSIDFSGSDDSFTTGSEDGNLYSFASRASIAFPARAGGGAVYGLRHVTPHVVACCGVRNPLSLVDLRQNKRALEDFRLPFDADDDVATCVARILRAEFDVCVGTAGGRVVTYDVRHQAKEKELVELLPQAELNASVASDGAEQRPPRIAYVCDASTSFKDDCRTLVGTLDGTVVALMSKENDAEQEQRIVCSSPFALLALDCTDARESATVSFVRDDETIVFRPLNSLLIDPLVE